MGASACLLWLVNRIIYLLFSIIFGGFVFLTLPPLTLNLSVLPLRKTLKAAQGILGHAGPNPWLRKQIQKKSTNV